MNKISELIQKGNYEDNKLYLLEQVNSNYGFFYSGKDKEVIFGKKSETQSKESSISTDYLDMELNVYIESLDNKNSYSSGNFDLLIFKHIEEETKMDIFYEICLSYANNTSDVSFADFFNSLVDIFKEHTEADYKDIVGLIGEMIFIKQVYELFGKNIAQNWHRAGINSKFDFSFPEYNIEVKTTSKTEQIFNLKHSQLFNNQKNYVSIINLIETGEGESIESLVDYFKNNKPFCEDVKMQICLRKELTRIRKPGVHRFSVDNINLVSTKDMQTLDNVPSCISKISYDYDFSEIKKISIADSKDVFN